MAEFDDLDLSDIPTADDSKNVVKGAVFANEGVNPDQRAEAIKLAERFKTPVEFVERNFDSFKTESSKPTDESFDDLVNNFPNSADFVSDPINAGLVMDGFESIKAIEQKSKNKSSYDKFTDLLKSGSLKALSGMNEFAEMNRQRAIEDNAELNKGLPKNLQYNPEPLITSEQADKYRQQLKIEIAKYESEDAQKSFVTELRNGNWAQATTTLTAQIIESLPQLAVTAMAPRIGLPILFASETGTKYKENVDAGIDTEKARLNARVTGAISASFEAIGGYGNPLKSILKRTERELGKQTVFEILKRSGKEIAKGSFEEGAEEFGTSVAQDITDYTMGVDPKALDGMVTRAVDGFFVGAGAGGFVGTIHKSSTSVRRYTESQRAEINRQTYMELGENAKQNKLRKRSPEKYEQLVNANSEIGKTYIEPESLDQYYQTKGLSTSEELVKLGMLEAYEKALQTGADVILPTGTLINKSVDSDLYNAIKDDIKFNPTDITAKQIKQQNSDLKQEIKKQKDLADKNESEGKEIVSQVYKQLIEAGASPSEAKASSILFNAIEAMAVREGQSPKELFDRYGLKIINGGEAPVILEGDVYNQTKQMFEPVAVDGQMAVAPQKLRSPIGFYSQLAKEVDAMDFAQMPAKDLANRIKNIQGIKKEELDFIGIDDFLKAIEGKVTKQQVLDFVNGNGLQVEQVVLGKVKGYNSDEDGNGGEGFDFSDEVFEEPDRGQIGDWVQSEMENIEYEVSRNQSDNFTESFFPDYKKENEKEYTDEESGEVDEDALMEAAKESYLEKERDHYEEHVATEDYFDAEYKITERNSGLELIGNGERGWYSSETGEYYNGNINEVKIQWANDLIEGGHVEGNLDEVIKDKDINWRDPKGIAPTEAVSKKQIKEILKEKKDEFRTRAESDNDYIKDNKTKFEKEVKADMLRFAEQEFEERISDPNNAKNSVNVKISSSYPAGSITGNSVVGWSFSYQTDRNNDKIKAVSDLEAKDLEAAKAEAVELLVKRGMIGASVPVVKDDGAVDTNAPVAKSKWKSHSVIGGNTYREILLTLPQSKEDFTYDTHFSGHKNFVAHVRISDAIVDGKKVLFIEEIQSDWHQQARKHGFKSEFEDLREQSKQQREELADKFNTISKDNDLYESIPKIGDFTSALKKARDITDDKESYSDSTVQRAILTIQHAEKFELLAKEYDSVWAKEKEAKDAVPDAPFKQTDAWASLVMKRMITLATEQGYDKVAWAPASVHQKRWGTDHVSWIKKPATTEYDIERNGKVVESLYDLKDAEKFIEGIPDLKVVPREVAQHWLVGAVEQQGGTVNVDGEEIDIEETARMRGELLERKGERVTTKEELHKIVAETLTRENTARTIGNVVERVWKQMQESDQSGAVAPRKEGMEFFYNKLVPDVTKKLLAKTDKDAKIKPLDMSEYKDESKGFDGKALSFDVTDKIKDVASTQGFPLFQQGDKVQGSYDPVKRLIALFTSKDKTTPLHEFGHFFLDVMSDLATAETASEGMKKDYAEVLKFLGVNSKEEIKRPQHELWARSFEAYLMEGNAPSSTMRKAFDSFKLWMIEAYRDIEGLAKRAGFPIKLTDEMRGVFDRLISVEQVIDDATADLGINALLKNPIADGMNEQMAGKYIEAIKDSRAYSESVLNKKLLEALNKKQSREYKNKFNIEFNNIKKELMINPVYNALQSLKTGKDNLGRTFDLPVKINRESVVTAFGEEIANKLPRSVYNKDGLHYEAASEFFGFESASEFITDMAQAEDINSVAKKQAEANLKGQFPDLFNDPEIMPEAIMALHNEKRGEALGLELEYLAEKHNALFKDAIRRIVKRAPIKAEVQEQAKKLIANEMVGDIKPHQFLNAERRMSKEAGKALASGDLAKAFEYKKAEYLNYELYRAAVEAQADVEKTVKKFKKIFKLNEDINKSRDLDYVNTARAILSLYGIVGGKNEEPLKYLAKTEKYDPERFASLEGILKSALEGAGQYDRVSYDKFTEMKNTVDALWDISKDEKEIIINGKAVALETAINELKATLEIDKEKTGNINIAGSVSDEEKRATGILGYIASNRIVLNWADLVDRGNADGAMKKYIWYPVSEAAAKYRDESFKLKQLFVQIVKDHSEIFDDKKVYGGDELEIESGQTDLLGNKYERVTFSFKKSEIIMMLLHSGNASNKSKLLRGGRNYKGQQYAWGSTDAEGNLDSLNFDKMFARWRKEGVLTKKDYEFAQYVWDLMESVKADVQKAHKKTEGYYFNEISASEIKNEFGTFRGGYMPAKVDIYTDETAELRAEKEKFENTNPSFSFPTISKGATMTRVDAYAKPLSLDFNLVKSHLDWTMKFAHLRPAIKDTNKIVSNEKFRNALRGVDEVAGKEMLAPWLQRSAEQNIILPSQGDGKYLDATARWLRTRFAMNALAGSLTNALQNFGSSIIATSKVPPKYILRASFDLVKNRAKSLKFITDSSDFMKGELNSDAARVLNQADDIITNASVYEVVADNIRMFSNVMDTMTTSYIKSHVWLGSYNYQMDNGVGHLVAKRLSDDLTRSVTSTINAEDVSRSMTGTQSKIFFTQFIGYFNRILNFRASEMAKIHKDFGLASYEGMKRAIPLIMLAGIIPAAYQAVVSKAVAGRLGEDEDGDGYLDEIMSVFFGSLFKETVVAVPVFGQVGVGVINTFNNRPNDDKITLAPAVSLADLAIKLPKGIIEGAAKSELKKQTVKDAFTAVGAVTNLPVGFLGKPVGYMMDVEKGKAKPKNELDFARGLISGQAGK